MAPDIFTPVGGYDRIKVVGSFGDLVGSSFGPRVNAICWQRRLVGDFDELAAHFSGKGDIVSLSVEKLSVLRPRLGPLGQLALDQVLGDLRLLTGRGLLPSLECVACYERDDVASPVPTDVYSFHADRAPVAADTYLCSYNGAATQGLRNDEAVRRIDIPAIRAVLSQQCAAQGNADFESYLRDNCYDLHYVEAAGAVPFSFGIGNLWRIAIEHPSCPVPPCLHRAPEIPDKNTPRLLLIS